MFLYYSDKKVLFFGIGLMLLPSVGCAADRPVERQIAEKLMKVAPQSPRYLRRIGSAISLAQKELGAAEKEGRNVHPLVQQTALMQPVHVDKMWEQVNTIQEQIKQEFSLVVD
jgi:hypothetical protein